VGLLEISMPSSRITSTAKGFNVPGSSLQPVDEATIKILKSFEIKLSNEIKTKAVG
jgi:hypothetical protein